MHQALLGGVEAQDDVFAVAAHDLRIGASRAGDLPALADLDRDVVHDRADRDAADRQRVARLHVHVLAGNDRVALREPLRRQDVGELAVLVLDQRDEAGAVGVVFDALDLGRHVEFAALEVDLAIGLLVATPPVAHGRAAEIVASPRRLLALVQLLSRFAPPDAGAAYHPQLALARRD